jgi:hypothetical protein
MAYTSVFLILTPLIMLSGMAMSPQLDTAFHWLPAMFGGRQSARSIHFILTFLFVGFTFGHVCMVLMTGILNNMRSMVSGWYKEEVLDVPEPPSLQTFKEDTIQKPSRVPVSRQLPEPKLEELSQETNQAPADAAEQDNGISKTATKDGQLGPENSTQTSTTHTHEAKKDIAE